MKRRDFINSSLIAAALSGSYGILPACASQNSRHLVSTSQKRGKYLAKILKRISTEIGPHPVGSPESEIVKQIIVNEMELALPQVELDTFTIDKWMLKGNPVFILGGKELEIYPKITTPGTPDSGVNGFLRKLNEKGKPPYCIIDKTTDNTVAYIVPYGGSARPTYARDEASKSLPTVIIGRNDVPLLDTAVRDKTPVFLKAPVAVIPNTEVSNVVGTLPGETKDEIVFFAHYDTVYSTPGANDNTASLAIMLMLAHTFSGTKPRKTLRFVATTGEERNDCMGAKNYADSRKREGSLTDIKFIVNFDSGTWNPDVEIWSEDKGLQNLMQEIDKDLNINGTPTAVDRTGFTLDAKHFRESGARAIYVESKGQDKGYLWHRPIDTPGNVQEFIVEINYLLFSEYIRRVQNM